MQKLEKEARSKILDTIKKSFKAIERPFPEKVKEQDEIIENILSSVSKIKDFELDENGNLKSDRLNIYIGEDESDHIITIDINAGNSPFVIQDPKTKKIYQSLVYLVPQDVTPTHEFYMPSKLEYAKLSKAQKDYLGSGKLLLRKIGDVFEPKFSDRIKAMTRNN
jgi:hypothetical protein